MKRNTEADFWKNVVKEDGRDDFCWLWIAEQRRGYGRFHIGNRMLTAHRYSYELVNGPIPEGLTLDHLCRMPLCVNPSHLEAVSHRENCLRGVGISTKNYSKTHCSRGGHPLSGENVQYDKQGRRSCRTCKRERENRRYQERSKP